MSLPTLLLLVAGVLVLVVVHEGGHALAAKALGVRVLEFAVGFGPVLLRWRSGAGAGVGAGVPEGDGPGAGRGAGGTLFTLRLLPLGGFARLPGMDPGADPASGPDATQAEGSFSSKSVWRRAAIVLAGPASNLLFAFLVLTALFAVVGLPDGDGGQTHSPARAALAALAAFGRFVGLFADIMGQLTGDAPVTATLSGPVGIAQTGTQAISQGLFWILLAFLSLNLAFFNLLPMPPLDGGHLLFLAAEKALGRPVSAHTRQTVSTLGVAFILTLALFATFGDVARLFSGG